MGPEASSILSRTLSVEFFLGAKILPVGLRVAPKEELRTRILLPDRNLTEAAAHGGCQVNGPKVAKFLDR